MKTYKGTCDEQTAHHTVLVHTDKAVTPLRRISYHSPTGFAWGYNGSAPADLALSILANHFGEKHVNREYLRKHHSKEPLCWRYHQDFKRDFVAKWLDESWSITSEEISEWVKVQPQFLAEVEITA